MTANLPTSVIEKFWSAIDQTNNCWNWMGTLTSRGAPCIRLWKPWKEYSARRVSLLLSGKEISNHDYAQPLLCDNKLCVNPHHLVIGDDARFYSSFQKLGDCWVWIKEQDKDMYGVFSLHDNGKTKRMRATAYSWFLYTGRQVPNGILLCHTCDHPYCVNPEHLFLGTTKDNALDMMQKGRGRSSLTAAIVREIRQLAQGGMKHKDIAVKYNVSPASITGIVKRERWAHII